MVRKRNVIIYSLCIVLLLMVVGYAAFATRLNINGTTSITSNWDIKITSIKQNTKEGDASSVEEFPKYEDLEATFNVNLVSPGDYIIYDVTVSNKGNINATLEKININKKINKVINITYEGIEAGETLNAGDSITFTVKVEYDENVTSQPKNLSSTFDMTLDYVAEGQAGEPSTNISGELVMGGQTVTVVAQDDGLYEDTYEEGRYIYKGTKPNNYITFNGERAGWRIVAIEEDGTIKIKRNNSITSMVFDSSGKRNTGFCNQGNAPSYGCNVWAQSSNFVNAYNTFQGAVDKDSEMKIYLNGTYYNSISKNKTAIENHKWYYGSVTWDSADLAAQIIEEKKANATSNIGLIQASDYLKSNTNTSKCSTFQLILLNYSVCKSTTWMVTGSSYWTISPDSLSSGVLYVRYDGNLFGNDAFHQEEVVPSLYLKSDILLSGTGTEVDPYTITNY